MDASQLKAIMPNVPSSYVEEYAQAITKMAKRFAMNTPLRLAAFLGIVAYESGELNFWRELDRGGGRFGDYYGRGPIQLTWQGNYKAAGDYLGLDLVSDPDMVARDTQVGFDCAGWFWRNANGDLNEFADEGDFYSCYVRVAGADNGTFPQRKQYYDRALSVLGNGGKVVTVDDVIRVGRSMMGASYGQWDGYWPPGEGAPFWMYGDVSTELVLEYGCNCAGFLNAIMRILGLPYLGGTGSIGDNLIELEDFDVNAPAVPGGVALRPWGGGVGNLEEGHVALYTGEHQLLQADHRGVNEDDTDYVSQSWAGFTVYGKLPGVDYSGSSPSPTPPANDEELWRKFGWYEAVNAQWDLKWHPSEAS